MQESEKQTRFSYFSKVFYLILITTLSFLLFFNGFLGIAILIIVVSLAFILISTALFTHGFVPELSSHTLINIMGNTISHGRSSHKSIIQIVDGKIMDDWAFPTKRYSNSILHIDPVSVVICHDQKTGFYLLHPGIHNLPRTASLSAVFPITPQKVIFGPESADSLSKARRGEGLADFHVRVNAAKMTATQTADGIVVYPYFECFYKMDIDHSDEGILALTKYLIEEKNNSAPVLHADSIQKHLFNLVMNNWEKFSAGKTSGQLIQDVPYKLRLDHDPKTGLPCQVFVTKIFR